MSGKQDIQLGMHEKINECMISKYNNGKAVYLVGYARKNLNIMISKRYVGKAGYLVGNARKNKKTVRFPNAMSGKQDI